MWYWIGLLWLPFGRIYIGIKLLIQLNVPLWHIFTKQWIHKEFYKAGIFGILTPLFEILIYGRDNKKQY